MLEEAVHVSLFSDDFSDIHKVYNKICYHTSVFTSLLILCATVNHFSKVYPDFLYTLFFVKIGLSLLINANVSIDPFKCVKQLVPEQQISDIQSFQPSYPEKLKKKQKKTLRQ